MVREKENSEKFHKNLRELTRKLWKLPRRANVKVQALMQKNQENLHFNYPSTCLIS